MEKKSASFLTFIILVCVLFSSSMFGSQARAASEKPQSKVGTFRLVSSLPAKICLKDVIPIIVSVTGNADTETEFVILTDNRVGRSRWPIAKGTGPRPPLMTVFTATKLGEGFINFGFVDGPAGQDVFFEVVECDYSITIKAVETETSDKVSWRTTISGEGGFSSAEVVGGRGDYNLKFSPTLEQKPDDPCQLTGESSGDSGFSVAGSNLGGILSLDISFSEVVIASSPAFVCDDENDNHGVIEMFEGATLDPDIALNLTGVHFAPGVTSRKLPFGSDGNCVITISKREKK